MDHLLQCPALAKEQILLKEEVNAKFKFWGIPYSSFPQKSREEELRNQWRFAARKHFPPATVSDFKLNLFSKGFYQVNRSKQFISTRQFLNSLSNLFTYRRSTPYYYLRQDLLSLLIQSFALQTQGFTDSWNYSPLFGEWTSIYSEDVPFGARLWSTTTMHEGCNAFFYQPPNTKVSIQGLLEILTESLETKTPTRFVLIVPKQEILPNSYLEIATLAPLCPLFSDPSSDAKVEATCTMSILLIANKESMAIDPINWEQFLHKIKCLSQNWAHDSLIISSSTDALFRERTNLPHSPRVLSKQPVNVFLNSSSTINFYDAFAPKTPAPMSSIPARPAELIRKVNQHSCFLGILGILPNHLRILLKESGFERREEALLELNRSLFFAGFRIWTKRQQLNSQYWNEIAPENPKNHKFATSNRKKHDLYNVALQSKCKNPFHFLVRHCNLSQQRPTKCPCRNAANAKVYKTQPITEFIFKFPRIMAHDSARTDPFYLFRSLTDNKSFITRADAIRKQHDRGKKRKIHPT
jgi:hypothetical protein